MRACIGGALAGEKKYDPGATDTEIKIGQSVPYSGPASAYGTYGIALAAYLKMINEQGGINGRKVTLISLHDAYSPPKALEEPAGWWRRITCWLSWVRSAPLTNVAAQKYLREAHVPNLVVISGASRFNDPAHFPWTLPGLYSYRMEAKIYGQYILATKPEAKIAVLYQNDDLGRDYLDGLKDGLGAGAGRMIVAKNTYEVSDPTVDSQILALQTSGADVLAVFANAKALAQAIRRTYDIGGAR